jgi:hypothetical protein
MLSRLYSLWFISVNFSKKQRLLSIKFRVCLESNEFSLLFVTLPFFSSGYSYSIFFHSQHWKLIMPLETREMRLIDKIQE